MPSVMQYGDVAGVKVVSVYNDNKKKYGLPTTIGTIILYDPETGDVITGKLPGRTNDREKILAGAVGVSVEDVICAELVYKKAIDQGYGRILDLEDL